ncbi:MAG: tRNA-dihydrouridine synthase [Parcubacteria group bacterium GW2011_GWA2_44_12]|nr:MAG: tRNA-dihydrouridine synthase [Parcubacteria group bacterium GW2011_GWA2_44_12]
MNNFWKQLKKPFLALAPMAGVTDQAFRRVCKEFGADVIYTEFASSEALVRDSKKTREMIAFDPYEQPVVCQIFGSNPDTFFQSVKILEEMGFAGVDINFGCPAYKVVKCGGGVSLMRNLDLCFELVQAACEGSQLPVSIKIRSSVNPKPSEQEKNFDLSAIENGKGIHAVTALNFVQKIKPLPVQAIMLHARSYERPFDGEPDIEMVQNVRTIWDRVLIVNGGITTAEHALELLKKTKADGLGIARGAWGKPWIFHDIKRALCGEPSDPAYKNFERVKEVIQNHARLAFALKGNHGISEMRKHLGWYIRGQKNAQKLRTKLVTANSLEEISEILNSNM